MEREKKWNGFLLEKILYLGNEEHPGLITLRTQKWEIMLYGDHAGTTVEFPGEYDVQWIGITCISAADTLHYVVRIDGKQLAIIQDKAVFDVANFDAVDEWIVTKEDIKNEIENLEFDGVITVVA